MTELKTKPNDASVEEFLNTVDDEKQKQDSFAILEMMKKITKTNPKMWGGSIVGFGTYHYKYASGRKGDWLLTGFSPRKQSLTIYIMSGFKKHDDLMKKLGKFKTGKSCLYIKKLEDIDIKILTELVKGSIEYLSKKNNKNNGA